jgi:hypothetical protein
MTLYKGNIIKLISADRATVVISDWLNSREAASGDIAVVEDTSITEAGLIIRLSCEPHAGFLEWRTSFLEVGLVYEKLQD